jgi:hypothetical protein
VSQVPLAIAFILCALPERVSLRGDGLSVQTYRTVGRDLDGSDRWTGQWADASLEK